MNDRDNNIEFISGSETEKVTIAMPALKVATFPSSHHNDDSNDDDSDDNDGSNNASPNGSSINATTGVWAVARRFRGCKQRQLWLSHYAVAGPL